MEGRIIWKAETRNRGKHGSVLIVSKFSVIYFKHSLSPIWFCSSPFAFTSLTLCTLGTNVKLKATTKNRKTLCQKCSFHCRCGMATLFFPSRAIPTPIKLLLGALPTQKPTPAHDASSVFRVPGRQSGNSPNTAPRLN